MSKKSVTILAIESSCDDTSAAIVEDGVVLSNITATQDVHREYGGVVPELASRQHLIHIIPVVDVAIKKAGKSLDDLNAVAFTRGPGLLGSLIVGVSTAKALALSMDIPLVEVHHMRAHVLAHFAEAPRPPFPFLCLTVSGGHTQILKVNDFDDMEVLGSTIDDAAGEAFDKTGKMLGLEYPSGPIIDRLAQQGQPVYSFPEPQVGTLDFSFSGLKTSVLYFLQKNMAEDPHFIEKNLADICCSVQTTIVNILIGKLKKASELTGIQHIGIAGGVSANSSLRKTLEATGQKLGWTTYIPAFQFCTDNAGMIGIAGYYLYLKGKLSSQRVAPLARMEI
ncbi:MAG: tRNA (adenosine(37)-N6)-threonylcarbamoyltransferase complex transferase subunit TsaD [Saprospiraceae bacterium]|nr:MAG: O-sialoglycoprotein endopeptidase [Bacteroidetes bacterium OLB9]MCO6464596.1 tRNA (adenosine(37)-N6)-threonylcarbamoyltransferase complex transferase subunit TsaD [Saprospiraceae bacterium]MCZ2337370.1 tRNA (adenosine(37)-N6)-threonylcarbamoyltransferase complex transferase subunit TsaD [Chitinophagales bacterium]